MAASKQRKLTDYIKIETTRDRRREATITRKSVDELTELLSLMVGFGVQHLGSTGVFEVLRVAEPSITFGGQHITTMFPREFGLINRFYTSDFSLKARFVLYTRSKYVALADKLKKHIGRILRLKKGLNFSLRIEPLRSLNPVGDVIRRMSRLDGVGFNGGEATILGALVDDIWDIDFARIKAYSIINKVPTHILNLDRITSILLSDKIIETRRLDANALDQAFEGNSPGYRAYLANNIVQLYAKSRGIPWAPGGGSERLLAETAVIGLSAAKSKNGDYYIGAAYAVAYRGAEVRSYVALGDFGSRELDPEILRTQGLYIPADVVKSLVGAVIDKLKSIGKFRRFIIFQSVIVHEQEIKALNEVLDSFWVTIHVKTSGFSKRVFDLLTDDYGPHRGILLVDRGFLENWIVGGPLKAVLVVTGKALVHKLLRGGQLGTVLVNLYKGTPRPLELEVFISQHYIDAFKRDGNSANAATALLGYLSQVIMLLGKLDWEAYTNWPKVPFVLKYSWRIARIMVTLRDSEIIEDRRLAEELADHVVREPRLLLYIM